MAASTPTTHPLAPRPLLLLNEFRVLYRIRIVPSTVIYGQFVDQSLLR